MPIYHFNCPKCGNTKEILCKIAERDEKTPVCCDKKMKNVIQPNAIMLKGSGWYQGGYSGKK